MKPGVWSSLRVRLLLLVLLAVIPALGLFFYTNANHRQLLVAGIEMELLRWARLAAVDYAELLDRADHLLVTLANLPDLERQDPGASQALLARLLADHPFFTNLGVADSSGQVISSALPLLSRDEVAQRIDLGRVMQAREVTVGAYHIDPARRAASVTAACPMPDASGGVRGMVFVDIEMGWFRDLASAPDLPPGTVLMALDEHGTIVARHPNPERWVGRAAADVPIVKTVLARGAGVAHTGDVDGPRRLFAFTLLEHAGAPKAYVAVGLSPSVLFARANAVFRRGVLWLGLASVLALAAAWIGGDVFVLRRVTALVRATKRLAAGDLAVRTGLRYGPGEIDQLARTFDEMAAALQRREAQLRTAAEALRRAHEELEIRVQERTANLRMANKRLEELSRLKDEFVSMVSHELRSPLVAAKGAVELVADATLGPVNDQQHTYLDLVMANVGRLEELISTILDVSKIEAGRLSLVRRRVNVPQLIEAAVKSYAGLSGGRAVTTECSPVPDAFADPNRVLQVVGNLFSNAVKFTREGGAITVAVQPQDGAVAVSVQDTGVGIAEEDLPKLFQKFSQVGSREARSRGTGLGLVLCKQLVDMHRGSIEVSSEPGRGTRVTFTLPAYTTGYVLRESLQELLESAQRIQQEAVAVIALDGQPFIERLATPAAERLERTAQSLRAQLLEDEVVVGIEPCWLAILSVTEADDVHVVRRRIRIAVERMLAGLSGSPPEDPAVSMGVVVYPADGTDAEALFLLASRSVTHEVPPALGFPGRLTASTT